MPTSPTCALAEFAACLAYDDLPRDVVACIKWMILDCLGAALAATTLGDACGETIAVMRDLGGKPESTIFGVPERVSAPNAAFANGALVHALNYDPIGSETGHLGVVCLAAPLATAEAVGGISGRTFIAASAAACEVSARITAAIARTGRRPSEKFLSGQLLSYFGAAAGAGRVLGLDPSAMRSALGLALMQMAGSRQVVLAGDPPAKAIYGAFPNHAGVLAALLSRAGVGADCDILGEPAGLYPMVYGGECVEGALTEDLGSEFLLTDVEFKPWPTSNHIHPFIEAAIEIARTGIDPGSIAAVEISAGSKLRPWCEPLDKRRRPENAAAAANSIPFCVAKALVHGDVALADVTNQGLVEEAALAVSSRALCRFDDSVKGALVRVDLRDGGHREAKVDTPLGHRSRPLSYERLLGKFRDCCRHASAQFTSAQVERLIAFVDTLEDCDDVSTLAVLANGASESSFR